MAHAHPHDQAHSHTHGPHDHGGGPRRDGRAEVGRLRLVLGVTAAFMVVEVAGGILSGSLALLADAGHMLADVGALGLSLWAMRLSSRPASSTKTYGYGRAEILAALLNGGFLVIVSGLIAWEAWRRLRAPVAVDGTMLSVVAVGGLVVNAVAARLLHAHAEGSLNARGAYLHVLGDLLGSVGALLAGAVIWATGWTAVDPLVSVAIAVLILVSSTRLVRDAIDVLLEAVPSHVDMARLLDDLRGVPELHEIHDLHVWTLTSGFVALSAHGIIDDPYHHRQVLDEVLRRVRRHGIEHVTFQLEPRELVQVKRPGEVGKKLP